MEKIENVALEQRWRCCNRCSRDVTMVAAAKQWRNGDNANGGQVVVWSKLICHRVIPAPDGILISIFTC